MYSRKLLPPPEKLVKNGKPVFGSFEGYVQKLDIRGIKSPYGGIPLPAFLSNFRIKSSINFLFNIGPFIGNIYFLDAKIFGFAEVAFWNKETKRKYVYKSIMGPRRRFIPHNLEQGFCASFGKRRYIRISWDHKRDRISMVFNMTGDSVRPSVQAAFAGNFSSSKTCEIVHNVPMISRRRCSASYYCSSEIHGSIAFGKTKISPAQTFTDIYGESIFFLNRSYYNFYTESKYVIASKTVGGKNISFFIYNTRPDVLDPENVNSNILVVDGKCTPLPPARITNPLGITKKWVIQDTENMIDLTFEPDSTHFRDMSLLVTHIQIYTIYGKFEGVLKTKDGEDIKISNFEGLGKNQLFRL